MSHSLANAPFSTTRILADPCQAMDGIFVTQASEASNWAAHIDHCCRQLEVSAPSGLSRTEKAVSWTHCDRYSMDAPMDLQGGDRHPDKFMGYDVPDTICCLDSFLTDGGNMMETSEVDEVCNEALILPSGGEANFSLDANTALRGAQCAGKYTGSSDNPFTRAFHQEGGA
jgi:hypothetical protein